MKLTINELMVKQVSIIAISQIKLPAHPTASRFDRALRNVASLTSQSVQDMQALYKNQGVLSEDGKMYLPPTEPEALAVFQAAQKEIQDRVVEIEFHPVHESELGNAPIEPAHLTALRGYMILGDDAEMPAPTPLKLVPATDA